ncbi:glucose-inhibited division protein B [Parahaliea sp. F7430]|uniref:Glucose-inhibited division protein B n=1 Tax=Sediminihaliea albiluteola TaxID=2758564 RepID=A0A7W2TTR4_9GAMM|nr:hypothetical protein [Sediminihaliea albiluteola]MBA6411795.1 glucose-inhibited division protein B [Sediminihaliea albiluteola]
MIHFQSFANAPLRLIAAIAIVLLASFLLACDGQTKAKQVSLSVLVASQSDYDDSQVITTGVVRRFEEPLHYWIEDEDLNRVEVFPHDKIAPYLGEVVELEGRFLFSATAGRRLTLTEIKQR